ncbi:helix-turn-helix domain-containing protein [Luteibacter aegosomatissinici]|uniref:helix-turn-helix domain-containing protein n=1 Tax=Luteibacter aegosomatissinici TaxID=2911539 RepID=UPI001FF9DC7A|nr:helix-turn-helix transcriptional regulator [Luteibacter aegosomatissinici]UPG94260.1 helix-turn-helix domain-containing protein [Luteibacter aegosomatissinici]
MNDNSRGSFRADAAGGGFEGGRAGGDVPASSFASRVRQVIKMNGSVSDIARRCGFSEGVVRSWRDGNTDPSRGRCVTMAKTLGISLVWLAAGEGPMVLDASSEDAIGRTETSDSLRGRDDHHDVASAPAPLDPSRLAAAMKLLQSDIEMAGSRFSPVRHADLVAEMYAILGRSSEPEYADRVIAFRRTVMSRIGDEPGAVAA